MNGQFQHLLVKQHFNSLCQRKQSLVYLNHVEIKQHGLLEKELAVKLGAQTKWLKLTNARSGGESTTEGERRTKFGYLGQWCEDRIESSKMLHRDY
jgi:hypothetical protein